MAWTFFFSVINVFFIAPNLTFFQLTYRIEKPRECVCVNVYSMHCHQHHGRWKINRCTQRWWWTTEIEMCLFLRFEFSTRYEPTMEDSARWQARHNANNRLQPNTTHTHLWWRTFACNFIWNCLRVAAALASESTTLNCNKFEFPQIVIASESDTHSVFGLAFLSLFFRHSRVCLVSPPIHGKCINKNFCTICAECCEDAPIVFDCWRRIRNHFASDWQKTRAQRCTFFTVLW